MSGQTRGLPLLPLPGESYLDAKRREKAGYQRDFRRKQRAKRPQPRILELVNVRG